MSSTRICKKCAQKIEESFNFCPHCGNIIKELPLSTSVGKQLHIYFVSFFFAPWGVKWGLPYLKQPSIKAKIIGIISIILTLLPITVMLFSAQKIITQYSDLLNSMYQMP